MDEEIKVDLLAGEVAAGSILDRANQALDKEHRLSAMTELQSRVEDWKGHKMDHFGDLLLHGNFTVLKGEGAKEVEREVSEFSLPPKFKMLCYLLRMSPSTELARLSSMFKGANHHHGVQK